MTTLKHLEESYVLETVAEQPTLTDAAAFLGVKASNLSRWLNRPKRVHWWNQIKKERAVAAQGLEEERRRAKRRERYWAGKAQGEKTGTLGDLGDTEVFETCYASTSLPEAAEKLQTSELVLQRWLSRPARSVQRKQLKEFWAAQAASDPNAKPRLADLPEDYVFNLIRDLGTQTAAAAQIGCTQDVLSKYLRSNKRAARWRKVKGQISKKRAEEARARRRKKYHEKAEGYADGRLRPGSLLDSHTPAEIRAAVEGALYLKDAAKILDCHPASLSTWCRTASNREWWAKAKEEQLVKRARLAEARNRARAQERQRRAREELWARDTRHHDSWAKDLG